MLQDSFHELNNLYAFGWGELDSEIISIEDPSYKLLLVGPESFSVVYFYQTLGHRRLVTLGGNTNCMICSIVRMKCNKWVSEMTLVMTMKSPTCIFTAQQRSLRGAMLHGDSDAILCSNSWGELEIR